MGAQKKFEGLGEVLRHDRGLGDGADENFWAGGLWTPARGLESDSKGFGGNPLRDVRDNARAGAGFGRQNGSADGISGCGNEPKLIALIRRRSGKRIGVKHFSETRVVEDARGCAVAFARRREWDEERVVGGDEID